MWRVELLHPLFVHFPIALLVIGSLLRLPGLWFPQVLFTSRLMIVLGSAFAWGAYVTGNLAEDEVNSTMCDPGATHWHGDMAFYVTLLFTAVALIDILSVWLGRKPKTAWFASTRVQMALLVPLLAGAGLMAYVGHLGASLVYQQGAAVYKPSPECKEFE